MKKILLSASYFLPAIALAAGEQVSGLLTLFGRLISTATPIVVALALLYFFWGLANYILAAGDEAKQDKGKDMMLWGVIALFVMVSIWGIVGLLGNTLGIQQGENIQVPTVQGL